jgi:drug/metabolite transporter (DMT)-like permease
MGLDLGLAGVDWRRALRTLGLYLVMFSVSVALVMFNKWLFAARGVGFPFPIAVTGLHMALNTANTWLLCRARGLPLWRSAGVTRGVFVRHFLAVGLFTGLDIALSNMSFIYLEASFVEMVKSSTPIWTLLLSLGLGLQRPSWVLAGCVLVMVAGQVAITHGEAAFDALGFGIVLTAAVGAAVRITLMQRLMLVRFGGAIARAEGDDDGGEGGGLLPASPTPGGRAEGRGETMSSLQAMAHVFPVSAAVMLLALPVRYKAREGVCRDYPSYCLEGFTDERYYSELDMLMHGHTGAGRPGTVAVLLFSCIGALLALALNGLEFVIVHRSSALTYTVMGVLKIILVFIAATLIFGNEITGLQVLGVVVSTCGMLAYNLVKLYGTAREHEHSVSVEPAPHGAARARKGAPVGAELQPLVRGGHGGNGAGEDDDAAVAYVLESIGSDYYLDEVPASPSSYSNQ